MSYNVKNMTISKRKELLDKCFQSMIQYPDSLAIAEIAAKDIVQLNYGLWVLDYLVEKMEADECKCISNETKINILREIQIYHGLEFCPPKTDPLKSWMDWCKGLLPGIKWRMELCLKIRSIPDEALGSDNKDSGNFKIFKEDISPSMKIRKVLHPHKNTHQACSKDDAEACDGEVFCIAKDIGGREVEMFFLHFCDKCGFVQYRYEHHEMDNSHHPCPICRFNRG